MLTDRVMSSGVVVSSIFFASDQLLRMEQLSVRTGSDFVYRRNGEPIDSGEPNCDAAQLQKVVF